MVKSIILPLLFLSLVTADSVFSTNPSSNDDLTVVRVSEKLNGNLVRLNVIPANVPLCPLDNASQVYRDIQLPNLPFFVPYNINEGRRETLSGTFGGYISCPLLMRFPGNPYVQLLPVSLRNKLAADKILPAAVTVAIVAQDLPFQKNQQLCFRPHGALDPMAPYARQKYLKTFKIVAGIFDSEGNRARFQGLKLNTVSPFGVKVHSSKGDDRNVFSPNNMHLAGVHHESPASFYTYTSWAVGQGRHAMICFHLLMSDMQVIDLRQALFALKVNEVQPNVLHTLRGDFLTVLREAAGRESFRGSNGLNVVIDFLLRHPPANVVPLAPPLKAVAPKSPAKKAASTPKKVALAPKKAAPAPKKATPAAKAPVSAAKRPKSVAKAPMSAAKGPAPAAKAPAPAAKGPVAAAKRPVPKKLAKKR